MEGFMFNSLKSQFNNKLDTLFIHWANLFNQDLLPLEVVCDLGDNTW